MKLFQKEGGLRSCLLACSLGLDGCLDLDATDRYLNQDNQERNWDNRRLTASTGFMWNANAPSVFLKMLTG